ncbi:MAG: hypothetical protein LBD57_00385 [Endomicrobium sp.]|uniref:hypothetical protein n=1 Tax=Candidatus Endomicrobiellum cubanum TaxID=3242325 RepID=UPI002822D832|nr:hypothetical protein [Endomicrobium sp.]
MRYLLKDGGCVEIKLNPEAKKNESKLCNICPIKMKCGETVGDYARLDTSLDLYLCYENKNIKFNVINLDKNIFEFKTYIIEMFGVGKAFEEIIGNLKLRITTNTNCCFNCRYPETTRSWCVERFYGNIMD